MAVIFNTTPWDDRILNLTAAQIDYIMAMYVADHPDEFKLTDTSMDNPVAIHKVWEEKLVGAAKTEYMRNPNAFLYKHYNWSPYISVENKK